jgi:predicted acylesterase/phospholipase RssA
MADRDIAIALSGGGYRAAFFHLGVLAKLHELGLLDRIGVISSVSGGSLVAAAYARSLLLEESFEEYLGRTRRFFESHTLDVPALLMGALPWRTSSRNIERSLLKALMMDGQPIMMSDLGRIKGVRFVFNSTAVHSGRGWRFISGGTIEEWAMGITHDVSFSRKVDRYDCDVSLARAAAASAAFPLFSALKIPRRELRDISEENRQFGHAFYKSLPDPICLSDGGVRDNTGLLTFLTGHAPPGFEQDYYVIGSDAGSPIEELHDPPPGWFKWVRIARILRRPPRGGLRKFRYLLRQFEIRGSHNDTIIKALFLKCHRTRKGSMKGAAVFQIEEPVFELEEKVEEIATLVRIGTRLKAPSWNHCEGLMNHGGNLVWARLTEYTDLLTEEQRIPGLKRRDHKE